MNAAAYYRVSSKSQDIAMQRDAVKRAVKSRGDKLVKQYAEKMSARTMARPELEQLRADARAGVFRKLYVFRLDRLSRTGVRDTFEVVEELRAHGVQLVSVADGFDLEGPAAEVVLAVMAWAAKMERLAINERIAAARVRLAAKGKAWGRPRRLDKATTERARGMRARGKSYREIAVALKVPRSTVRRAIEEGL